ncbi:MAG: GH39 family glycosyl hydrolase [Thermoguttaceae bacterium]|jgi:hypothetical protein
MPIHSFRLFPALPFLLFPLFFAPPHAEGTAPSSPVSVGFRIDSAQTHGKRIGNKVNNVNLWTFRTLTPPEPADRAGGADLTPFVEYVQFMQATGSSPDRDLFKDPLDRTVLDDYDFGPLSDACALVLSLGAKPHIKFSVPTKYSSEPIAGDFQTNVLPPDDYEVYGAYVHALARALVDRFGRDEVRQWRFGVLTEYENRGWFRARSGEPDESREAYFKLYDYTAEALTSEIGSDVCIGAHAMACSEGLWDERDLLDHCASGRNFKTGEIGTRICFMAVSFYDPRPGTPNKVPLPEVVGRIRARAEEVGLRDLFYGVDEGRILFGLRSGRGSADLTQRMVGRTYQAAYDARLLKQAIDAEIDYISAWSYSTGAAYHGIPTVSYFVARYFSELRNAFPIRVHRDEVSLPEEVEVDAVAGYEPESKSLYLMVYHFKDDIEYTGEVAARLSIAVPEFAGRTVRVTRRTVDDSVNFFPEWEKDRERLGIDDSRFTWSPDDPGIDSGSTLSDPESRKIYATELRPRYAQIARLTPETNETAVPDSGTVGLDLRLDHHAVVFLKLEPTGK